MSASSASIISKKTGLPLPRFVSLKGNKVNLRRGPSLDYKIDWVYQRKHLPVMIVSEFGHWRKVTILKAIQVGYIKIYSLDQDILS